MVKEPVKRPFQADLGEIRTMLLEMGGKVELMIDNSIKALAERDSLLAESIITSGRGINPMEREIVGKCLHLLAWPQPVARDLRFVTLALKIVIDLERIGGQCTSIAGDVLKLNREGQFKPMSDLALMAETAHTSVREALDAFINGNEALAAKVFLGARVVDELNDRIQRVLLTFMMEDPATISQSMRVNSISKCLETIADHASNIAESVIFMAKMVNIRHSAA